MFNLIKLLLRNPTSLTRLIKYLSSLGPEGKKAGQGLQVMEGIVAAYATMDDAMSDQYMTQKEAMKVGFAFERIYRDVNLMPARTWDGTDHSV